MQDGIAIAWALSEHLIALGAYTVFATHFSKLVQLEALYPNCKALQLGCSQSAESSWKLEPYSPQSSHYGLLCAPQVCSHHAGGTGLADASRACKAWVID